MFSDVALLSVDFDETEYLKHTLHLPTVEAEQSRLNRSIELVQQEIRSVIGENAEELLSQVDAACDAEKELAQFRNTSSSLSASSRRLRHTIEEPCLQISIKLSEMKNSLSALDTLRSIQRFLAAESKLPELLASDVARAARTLKDIEDLLSNGQLAGIDVVDRALENVTKSSAAIRSKAHEMLKTAMMAQNQGELSVALQCFFSLGTLHRVVANIVAEQKREAIKTIVRELDFQAIQQAVAESTGNEGARTRDTVFGRLDAVLADVVHRTTAVLLLWKVLSKKKDPASHEIFMSAVDGASHILNDYWTTVSTQLTKEVQKMQKRTNISVMLVAEFQRFYVLMRNFSTTLEEFFSVKGSETSHSWLKLITSELEGQFSQLSVDRHREKVQQIVSKISTLIPQGAESLLMDIQVDLQRPSLPSATSSLDVKGLLKLLSQEMAAYRQDNHLLVIVLKNWITSLTMIKTKMSDASTKVVLPPLPSITTSASAGQVFHMTLSNAATAVFNDLSATISMLPTAEKSDSEYANVLQKLTEIANSFRTTSAAIVAPFFASITFTLLKCLSSAVLECTDDSGLQQAHARMLTFITRFMLLFDKATPAIEQQQRMLCERITSHVLVATSCLRPLDHKTVAHSLRCLTSLTQLLGLLPNSSERLAPQSRAQLHVLKHLLAVPTTNDQWQTQVQHLTPALELLHVFQRVAPEQLISIHSMMRLSEEKFVDTVSSCISDGSTPSFLWEHAAKCLRDYEARHLSDLEGSLRQHVVVALLHRCRDRLLPS